jgi:DNA repair protein RadA/Sms
MLAPLRPKAPHVALVPALEDQPRISRVYSSEPSYPEPIRITAAEEIIVPRTPSGLAGLDRVLGGGLVVGSAILLSGSPGAGKSSLVAQLLAGVSRQAGRRVLYATGEESVAQAAMRARRVNAIHDQIWIVAETDVDRVIAHARAIEPAILAIDSIQTMSTEEISGSPGSLVQVRECAARLARYAKETETTTILVGHVTKDGAIAGPKTLEHLVDVTLQLEAGEAEGSAYRYLRAHKNRFGSTLEVGAFEMLEKGLVDADEEAARAADADPTFELGILAQELLDRYQIHGGIIDDGMRERIAGRLDPDAWRRQV